MRIDSKFASKFWPKRKEKVHKGRFGKLLVIGGSKLYSGSPALASLSAYRAGVDLVITVAPKRAANIIASFDPDLITHPLDDICILPEHVDELLDFAKNCDAFVIGGGMRRKAGTFLAINKLLSEAEIPGVIDADGIYAVAKEKEGVMRKNFVLTPHSYEFKILTGKKFKTKKDVKRAAKELKATILLTRHEDIISDGQEVAINKTGSPYLTVGGTGDTLAGICGALLARKATTFDSACAAAWLNGKAGELASEEYGESLMASDLLDYIPKALKKLKS